MAETLVAEADVRVDFPQAGEIVTARQYTIRLGAIDAAKAEVSIDNGSWQPCRFAVGYFWYDWAFYEPGKHTIKARVGTRDGHTIASPLRAFLVRFEKNVKQN